MAGTRRATAKANADAKPDGVNIRNADSSSTLTSVQLPRKRKHDLTGQGTPEAQRRAPTDLAKDGQKEPGAGRLRHPSSSKSGKQPRASGGTMRPDVYNTPQSPERSEHTLRESRRPRTADPLPDANNGVHEGEGLEVNSFVAPPAFGTRSHDAMSKQTVMAEVEQKSSSQSTRRARSQRSLVQKAAKQSSTLGRKTRDPLSRQEAISEGAPPPDSHGEGEQSSESDEIDQTGRETGEPDADARPSRALKVFEKASALHGCKETWERMMVAAKENQEDAGRVVTLEIKELATMTANATRSYRSIRHAKGASSEDLEFEIEEHFSDIRQRIKDIKVTGDEKHNEKLIEEMYLNAIPKMVFLLRAILIARYQEEAFSVAAYAELIRTINSLHKLCDKAFRWKPRPNFLKSGVRKNTNNVIKISLQELCKIYEAVPYNIEPAEAQNQILEQRKKLADWATGVKARDRDQKLRNQGRQESGRDPPIPELSVIDIDDLGADLASHTLYSPGRSFRRNEISVGVASISGTSSRTSRQKSPGGLRMTREHTEDIPPPMTKKWSRAELQALLGGLEEFTKEDRYLKIAEIYGGRGGPLSSRDLDELMLQAKFFKQSMLRTIKAEAEETGSTSRWDWLLNVDSQGICLGRGL